MSFKKGLKHTDETRKKISESIKFNYLLKSIYKKNKKNDNI